MSRTASSTRQVHTILGGGMRYETAELLLSAIPNFELKQKGRILQLFAEIYNVFIEEIQEALDERQNNLDSLLAHDQADIPAAEPFAFESQIDTNTYPVDLSSKSIDDSFQPTNEPDTNVSNETVPLLTVPNEREQSDVRSSHRAKSTCTSMRDPINIKKELITPPKAKRRQSKTPSNVKQKPTPSVSPLRQMTMTQLFDRVESPTSTSIKNEPETPRNDTLMFMPESLIGLAQPSDSMQSDTVDDDDNEAVDGFHSASPTNEPESSRRQSFKRKSIPSPTIAEDISEQVSTTTDEEENIQNNAILQSPYSGIESEELLYACPMCRNYWLGLPAELRHKQGLTCRHRQRPVARTPEHFWSLGIPSTQTCIERGYGGVLPPDKPIERPRRPRRQFQRRLQEQQQPPDEDSDAD